MSLHLQIFLLSEMAGTILAMLLVRRPFTTATRMTRPNSLRSGGPSAMVTLRRHSFEHVGNRRVAAPSINLHTFPFANLMVEQPTESKEQPSWTDVFADHPRDVSHLLAVITSKYASSKMISKAKMEMDSLLKLSKITQAQRNWLKIYSDKFADAIQTTDVTLLRESSVKSIEVAIMIVLANAYLSNPDQNYLSKAPPEFLEFILEGNLRAAYQEMIAICLQAETDPRAVLQVQQLWTITADTRMHHPIRPTPDNLVLMRAYTLGQRPNGGSSIDKDIFAKLIEVLILRLKQALPLYKLLGQDLPENL